MSLPRYEYRVEVIPEAADAVGEILNTLGKDSWELVDILEGSYHDDAPYLRAVFKRELMDE